MRKECENEEITMLWKPEKHIHSKHCWQKYSKVFNPGKKRWIDPAVAGSGRIKRKIEYCRSVFLSCNWNVKKDILITTSASTSKIIIEENEQTLVKNVLQFHDKRKDLNIVDFCRCGISCNKPFCNENHIVTNFKD